MTDDGSFHGFDHESRRSRNRGADYAEGGDIGKSVAKTYVCCHYPGAAGASHCARGLSQGAAVMVNHLGIEAS